MKFETARRLMYAFLFAFLFAQTMDVAIADSEHPQAKEAHETLKIDVDGGLTPSDDIHCGCHNFHHLSITADPIGKIVFTRLDFTFNSFETLYKTNLSPPVPPPLA